MKVKVVSGNELDLRGTQAKLIASISDNTEPVLMLTKREFDRLNNKAIAEIRAVKAKGYFVLKVARILRGLRQSDMAKMLGISLKTYQRRETRYNNTDFTLVEISTISCEFKISIDSLFFTNLYLNIA